MASTIIATGPTYRVYCRAAPNYNMTVGKGAAFLAPIDETNELQYWYKDDTYSYIKDEAGLPAFSLVNKATGLTLKHSNHHPVPVKLVTYNPNVVDESVLWSQADDRGDGYTAIRSLTNPASHLEAAPLNDWSYNGAIIMGGVWIDAYNQQWKIEPHTG
uniref:Lectin 2 n=1 Tax=Euonymus europaeus TaxID=123417 RepID=B3SV75_EUOEU|nr:lectin 2 [Euonymus europaeus]